MYMGEDLEEMYKNEIFVLWLLGNKLEYFN